jgi:glycosyltransferase involved in cell wall biosynthesis
MRILTFNWHEPYICALAKTGHAFDVVERDKGGYRGWMYEQRPLPPNVRIVKDATARQRLRAGEYSVVVCHNLTDLGWVGEYRVPRIVLFHNMLTTELALGGNVVDGEAYRAQVRTRVANDPLLSCVFISDGKRADWGLAGDVITPGIDLADYGGYEGGEARVLRVANLLRERDLMLGYTAQRQILQGIPSTLLGLGTEEYGGRFSTGWDDLRGCFRSHRLFLNTTVDGYEDGYNLAMLEAMATGTPVVSTANRTSPIVDGVNGFVSADLPTLSDRINQLLRNPEEARQLGAAARATVATQFSMDTFVARWEGVLLAAARRHQARRRSVAAAEAPRKKILLAYVSYPLTTARYLEKSLRKRHDVITVGPAIDERIIRAWNLSGMREPVVPHNVPCAYDVDMDAVVTSLPRSWRPDLFLWVDSVPGYAPRNIARLDCPTACYLIDTHLNLPTHRDWAPRFDWAFLVHRQYCADIAASGCARVAWLPVACDPETHAHSPLPKRHDIGFVGSMNQDRRGELLERIGRRWPVHVERSFLRDMARTFAESRIVFNNAVRDDLNMRVFEAMASGSMLLTDRAPGSGLTDMFQDGQHLALYDDDNLEEKVAYYLAHEDEREAIAMAGRAEVLRWHTYDHRAATLIDCVFGNAGAAETMAPANDPLLADAVALLHAARPADALSRLETAAVRRELSSTEQALRAGYETRVLDRLGRRSDAQRQLQRALRALPEHERRRVAAATI